jgi:hypothetical protein
MSNDIFFGPSSKKTYAALSPTDLETMGKIAANRFLSGEMSLNDAIVKMAREQPSISNHQVRRVVEFANQEAFQRLFEKQAGDKNVEFPIADPGHVLSSLNNSAKPGTVFMSPSEYESGPVKHASADVEADLVIARMFGYDLASPLAEKTADEATDRIMRQREDSALGNQGAPLSQGNETPNDARGMSYDEEAMKLSGPMDERLANMTQQPPQDSQQAGQAIPQAAQQSEQAEQMPGAVEQPTTDGPAQSPDGMGAQQPADGGPATDPAMATDAGGEHHQSRMLGLQREIEYAKKREELAKIQQKMVQAMNPGVAAPGQDPNQAAAEQAAQQTGGDPTQAAAQAQQAGGQDPNAQAAQDPSAQPQDPNAQAAAQDPSSQAQAPQEQPIPPPLSGAIMQPPGSAMPKTSAARMTKEAMAYVKAGRPGSDYVLQDLRQAVSLAHIKMATARRADGYAEANPYGDLIRMRQKVAMLRDEAKMAVDTNIALTQEAMDGFVDKVAQHILSNGSIGEVAHAIESTPGETYLKEVAIKTAMQDLTRRGLDPVQARAELITYEMSKRAHVRATNPNNPIVSSFLTFHKLAMGQSTLNEALKTLDQHQAELNSTFNEVVRHASSRQ